MNRKRTLIGTMLTLFLASMLFIAFDAPLVRAEEEIIELRIENSDHSLSGGSTVYYSFEIIDPDRTAYPGEMVYFDMRITNLLTSTTALSLSYGWGGWYLPLEYGTFYFDIEWPTIPIGETYEGPFGHFVFTDAIPIGYVFTGAMGIGVYEGDPPFRKDVFTITIVAVEATVDVNPDTLNLKSKGKWVTAYIQLPEEYNTEDIDATTVLLNDTIKPVLDPKYDFVTNSSEYLLDHNEDGILERMVKFNRAEVMALLSVGEATLNITGEVDGTPFEGSDTIKVIYE